jgi:3'-5' exonuclease
MHNIYLDIETICGPTPPTIEELMANAPGSMKKPETIRAWAEENQMEQYRKQALDSMQGEILAVGWTCNDDAPTCHIRMDGVSEEELLGIVQTFIMPEIRKHKGVTPTWVGHNIKGFDLPWLWRKCLKYELYDLARAIPRGRYSKDIEDTMEMWAIDFKDHVSLSKIAAFFGLNGKVGGLDGSKVYDAWRAGEFERIAEYCVGDVALVREVHARMKAGMV